MSSFDAFDPLAVILALQPRAHLLLIFRRLSDLLCGLGKQIFLFPLDLEILSGADDGTFAVVDVAKVEILWLGLDLLVRNDLISYVPLCVCDEIIPSEFMLSFQSQVIHTCFLVDDYVCWDLDRWSFHGAFASSVIMLVFAAILNMVHDVLILNCPHIPTPLTLFQKTLLLQGFRSFALPSWRKSHFQ